MSSANCHYCGLPVSDADGQADPIYCCYGCSLAAAIAGGRDDAGESRGMMARLGLAIFFSMNVMVFTFFLWSEDAAGAGTSATIFYDLARYVCLLFTIPVILLLAGPLASDAWTEFRRIRPSLSMLLLTGVLAAYFYSVDSVFRSGGHVYFEVSCSVLVAVTLGKWLEATGKLKTTAALRSLEQLLPETARRIAGGSEKQIPRREIQIGDRLRVLPGERIPVDGVTESDATIDEQMVTGESFPVDKAAGSRIFSGTVNLASSLTLVATSETDAGFIGRIIQAVTRAAATKDRLTRLAERLALWFLPIVLAIAATSFVAHGISGTWEQGLLAALAVVVIACPCALGLATPMAIWSAFGEAARRQVLIHHGDSFTQLARVRAICFDKTGTLTTGQVQLSQVRCLGGNSGDSCLAHAAALACHSTHPLSLALMEKAQERSLTQPASLDVRTLTGRGIVATSEGQSAPILLGNERLLAEFKLEVPFALARELDGPGDDGPLAWLAWGGQVRALFRFRETLRPEVSRMIAELVQQGIAPIMLTGDRAARARQLGTQLGMEFRSDLLPEDKLTMLREIKRRYGLVAMVGDGINDAPALAAADVGIALGSGADISRDCAGLCLLSSDLSRLPWLIDLSRRTVRTIQWNLVWAFAYNVIGMGFAAAGYLHPAVAAVAMVVSSLLVVTNSLRLAQEPEALVPQAPAMDLATGRAELRASAAEDRRLLSGAIP